MYIVSRVIRKSEREKREETKRQSSLSIFEITRKKNAKVSLTPLRSAIRSKEYITQKLKKK